MPPKRQRNVQAPVGASAKRSETDPILKGVTHASAKGQASAGSQSESAMNLSPAVIDQFVSWVAL